MFGPADIAAGLLNLAADDEFMAKSLLPIEGVSDAGLGFHCLCEHQHNACYANFRIMLISVVGVALVVVIVAWGSA